MRDARFGPFRLDLSRRELWQGDRLIPVGARALDILCVLVSARGEVVSKDELMAKVWPETVVEENNIQVHVSALRKAIADATSPTGYLLTVPGRGYRFVGLELEAEGINAPAVAAAADHPPLPHKPSIAVLPFVNLGGDAEQEYFADGITEDIITALAHFRWFFVIARNSSFAYRGRSIDVKQVARELGVRYVLEGSVRRSADRVRISTQLIDANAGTQIWGDRYDRELADIFAVQDEITEQVVGAVEPELLKAEGGRAVARASGSLSVWDLIRQGTWHFHQLSEPTHLRALELFKEATRIAPDLPEAQMWVSRAATGVAAYGWCRDPDAVLRESLAAALAAVRRDEKDAYSHFALAMTHVFLGNLLEAVRAAEKAVELGPSFALAHVGLGMALLYSGKPEEALEPMASGLRLNPFDPQNSHWFRIQALALYFANQKERALASAQRALKARPGWPLTLETAAICHVALGQMKEARACLEQMRRAPAPKGDPTAIMRKRNPTWATEIAAQLRKAATA
jgi:TolB-like protein